jgi:hypothetical protein
VFYKYRAKRQELAERLFKCENCGARGEVAFLAKGESAWKRDSIWGGDPMQDAADQAEHEMMADADRALAMVKCPTCGERGRGAVKWSIIRVTMWFGVASAVFFGTAGAVITLPGICAILGAVQVWSEVSRVRRANRAQILKLAPGNLPERAVRPKQLKRSALPVARVLTAPPARLEAPRPVITAPPPAPPQRGPDEEPAFLRPSKD